jgi:hypothetical protein
LEKVNTNDRDIILKINYQDKILLMGALGIALESVEDENEVTLESKRKVERMLDVLRSS